MAMLSGKEVVKKVSEILNRFSAIRNIRIGDNLTIGEAVADLVKTYDATELAEKLEDLSVVLGKGTVLTIRIGGSSGMKYEMDVQRPGQSLFTACDNTFAGLVEQAIELSKEEPKKESKKKGKKQPQDEKLL